MKKLLVLLFLMLIGTSVYAQKRYVHISYYYTIGWTTSPTYISLSGFVPTDMESSYSNTPVGDIIDSLAQRGYVVEQLSNAGFTYNEYDNNDRRTGCYRETIIMSISSTPTSNISEGDVNKDGEVNIGDINKIVALILGIIKENPSILEQIKD